MANPENTTTSNALFQASPTPRVSPFDAIMLVVSMVLVFGGFYLMGAAFSSENWGFEIFAAGIAADALGLWLAFGVIPSRDK